MLETLLVSFDVEANIFFFEALVDNFDANILHFSLVLLNFDDLNDSLTDVKDLDVLGEVGVIFVKHRIVKDIVDKEVHELGG